MNRNYRKHDINKKIPIIISLILLCIILFCFLYSFIQLVLDPSNIFVVEERKYISRGNNLWVYCKRRKCIIW